MAEDQKSVIAHAIYDWLIDGNNDGPSIYNEDLRPLETGVDGMLDCERLAKFIAMRLEKSAEIKQ